jgi:small subunit ribosomal protein S16
VGRTYKRQRSIEQRFLMVIIRLSRVGTKKVPHYRIVAVDRRKPRTTRVLEYLGTYSPLEKGHFNLQRDKYERWVGKGAQVSDTVASLVRRHKPAAETPAQS